MPGQTNEFDILTINGYPFNAKDSTARNDIASIISAMQANNTSISGRINDLNDRSFDNLIKISSNNESEISDITDGIYKIQYVTITIVDEETVETLNNSAILVQNGINQYIYKDGQNKYRIKENNTWGNWELFDNGGNSGGNSGGSSSSEESISGEYINKYFSFINRQSTATSIHFNMNGSANLYYSLDDGETWSLYTSGTTISIPGTGSGTYSGKAYGKVMFKGNLITLNTTSNGYSGIGKFVFEEGSDLIDAEGNIMSLLYGDDFINDNQNKISNSLLILKTHQFVNLFNDFTYLNDASNLILPSYYLSTYAYYNMFKGCINLKFGPKILAKYGDQSSFRSTFMNCTSLIETSKVELISGGQSCFNETYKNCTSLIKAHDIVCDTINTYCFENHFAGCTSLINPPQIYVKGLYSYCFKKMFDTCTSLVKCPELPYTTLAEECYYGMFNNCNSLTETPSLPATILVSNCYNSMFANCGKLTKASLPNFTLANNCCNMMFKWCPLEELEFLTTDDYTNYTNALYQINYNGNRATKLILNNNQTWFDKRSKNPFSSDYIPYTQKEWSIIRNKDLKDVYDAIGYKDQYLTFTALTAGVLRFEYSFLYSIDNGISWRTVKAEEDTELFSANTKILCKATRNPVSGHGVGRFYPKSKAELDAENATYEGTEEEQATAKAAAIEAANKIIQCNVEGNPASLCYGDNFHNKDLKNYMFLSLFIDNTNIINAKNLSLPYNTVYTDGYKNMFKNCTNLVSIPELPAKIVYNTAYSEMFNGCTSLVNAPELPATEIRYRSYYQMFYGCTSLITAPKLPITVFNYNGCYEEMFKNCTSLVNAPELPATTLMQDCYKQMFTNCTSLVNAPELPATTLVTSCYSNMFYGCSSLKYVKALFIDSSATNCLTEWLKNTSNTGNEIFVKSDSNANWPSSRGNSTVPSNWTIYDESDYNSLHKYEFTQLSVNLNKIPIVSPEASASITIDPYKMYSLGTISSTVNISFDTTKEISGYCAEYMIRFTAGANCQIYLPVSVLYNGGTAPQFTQGRIYEIDVTDNLCVVGEYYS